MQLEFERAVIATFLFADRSQIESYINSTELYEEWFTDFEHKRIVHAINHLKATGFYDELTVKDYLARIGSNGTIFAVELCLDRNIAGSEIVLKSWINRLKLSIKNKHEAI